MSITITCEFANPYEARQAETRMRRRGYIVSSGSHPQGPLLGDKLLVAYPYGAAGGNGVGNNLMGGLPPMAGNGITVQGGKSLVSVLTDDTRSRDARDLLEALGGKIL